jgi:hypothetical protein
MPHLPSVHHETSKCDSLNETKIKQNKTIPDSNSNLAKSMTHHNQTKELTTWFLNNQKGNTDVEINFYMDINNEKGKSHEDYVKLRILYPI